MLKYKNPENNEVYAYSEDQKHIIPENFIAITDEEAELLINPPLSREQKLILCKSEAKLRLQTCDWTQMADVNLTNKDEFVAYRFALRELVFNPVEDPTWPTEPKPNWIK